MKILIALPLLLIWVSLASADTISATAWVIDGDTIDVAGVRIRINGIDAAEIGQKCQLASGKNWQCADAAAERLVSRTLGQSVECDAHGQDG